MVKTHIKTVCKTVSKTDPVKKKVKKNPRILTCKKCKLQVKVGRYQITNETSYTCSKCRKEGY